MNPLEDRTRCRKRIRGLLSGMPTKPDGPLHGVHCWLQVSLFAEARPGVHEQMQ
jgi:hypothetical protein